MNAKFKAENEMQLEKISGFGVLGFWGSTLVSISSCFSMYLGFENI